MSTLPSALACANSLPLLLKKCADEDIQPVGLIVWSFNNSKFSAFRSIKSFYKYMMTLPPQQRNFCETIVDTENGGHQKPRFDLDIKKDELPIMVKPQDIINELCYAIINALPEINIGDICIYSSNGSGIGEKYSYHIIVDHWYHNNSKEARMFYNSVIKEMPTNMSRFVDFSVYKSTQQFRMLHNTKPITNNSEARYKTRETKWNYFGEEVVVAPVSNYREFRKSLITYTKNCLYVELSMDEAKHTETQENPMRDLSQSYLESLVPDGYILDIRSGKKDYGWRLIREKASYCLICQRLHGGSTKGDNGRIFVNDQGVYFACFRDSEKRRYLLDTLIKPSLTAKEKLKQLNDENIEELKIYQQGKNGGRYINENELMEIFGRGDYRKNGPLVHT